MRILFSHTNWNNYLLLVFASISQALFSTDSIAGVVNWHSVQAITGESDVDLTGSLVYAYNFGPNSGANQVQQVTVRGVIFQALGAPPRPAENVNSVSIGDVTLSESPGVLNGFITSSESNPFSNLSGSYKGLLGNAIAPSLFSTMTLSLGGLETGRSYRFQTWVNDSINDTVLFRRVEIGGGGNTTELKTNIARTVGGLGEHVLGTFIATSTTQDITFNGMLDIDGINNFKNPIVNAFQLRLEANAPVPEPTSMAIFGLGALGMAYRLRHRARAVRVQVRAT
jgi:hypothetical protein